MSSGVARLCNTTGISLCGNDLRPMTRKTAEEVRLNIEALLRRDGVTPAALAGALRKHRSWMSRFLARKRHELQLCDLDKIADFFQVTPYDLLRPSGGSVTNRRRTKLERRSGIERRVSHARHAMLTAAAEIDRVRPVTGSRHVEEAYALTKDPKVNRLIDEFLRKLDPLISPPHPGGQAPVARRSQPKTRTLRRVTGGQDHPSSTGKSPKE